MPHKDTPCISVLQTPAVLVVTVALAEMVVQTVKFLPSTLVQQRQLPLRTTLQSLVPSSATVLLQQVAQERTRPLHGGLALVAHTSWILPPPTITSSAPTAVRLLKPVAQTQSRQIVLITPSPSLRLLHQQRQLVYTVRTLASLVWVRSKE